MALGGKYTLLPSSARQSALRSARESLLPRSCLTLLDWRLVGFSGHSSPPASVSVGQVILDNIPGAAGQAGSYAAPVPSPHLPQTLTLANDPQAHAAHLLDP